MLSRESWNAESLLCCCACLWYTHTVYVLCCGVMWVSSPAPGMAAVNSYEKSCLSMVDYYAMHHTIWQTNRPTNWHAEDVMLDAVQFVMECLAEVNNLQFVYNVWSPGKLWNFKCKISSSGKCSKRSLVPLVLWHCWLGKKLGFGLSVVTIWLELLPSSLAPVKSRMETFWYQLIQVVLENGRQTSVVIVSLKKTQKSRGKWDVIVLDFSADWSTNDAQSSATFQLKTGHDTCIFTGFPRLLESPGFFLENSRTWKVQEKYPWKSCIFLVVQIENKQQ